MGPKGGAKHIYINIIIINDFLFFCRFILLPAFLGDLELKLTSGKDRKTIVENAFVSSSKFAFHYFVFWYTKTGLVSFGDMALFLTGTRCHSKLCPQMLEHLKRQFSQR